MIPRSISPFERYGHYVPLEDATLTEHLLVEGQSMSGLAHFYYTDWRKWREIADRNQIKDPRQISAGTLLLIPRESLELGRYEKL